MAVFVKNPDWLLTTETSKKVMAAILRQPELAPLLSDDHFRVDVALIKLIKLIKVVNPWAVE